MQVLAHWLRPARPALAAAVGVLLATAVVALGSPPAPGEGPLFEAVNGLPDGFEPPLVAVEQLGLAWMAPAVAAVLVLITWSWRAGAAALVAGVTAWWLANVLKDLFERSRPAAPAVDITVREHVTGFGYPSSHAAVAGALAAVAVIVLPRRWRWVAVVLAAAVAAARVYQGLHYPVDVVGGVALGATVGALAHRLLPFPDGRRRI